MSQSVPASRFAVLLCTHNGERYVEEQIRSILRQSVLPEYLAIHDWGSTDRTLAIVERQVAETSSIRIVVRAHAEAPGPCASFMMAIRETLSHIPFDYLLLCDQDDVWRTDKLQILRQRLRGTPGECDLPALVFSDVRVVGGAGQMLKESFYGDQSPFQWPHKLKHGSLLLANPCIGMTMCLERAFLQSVASHLSGYWVMHDWALVLLAIGSGRDVVFEPETLVDYRQHEDNNLGATKRGITLRRLRTVKRHFSKLRAQAARVREAGLTDPDRVFPAHLLRDGFKQRLHLARCALASPLLKQRERVAFGAAILLFW